jgi:hypothetical protein
VSLGFGFRGVLWSVVCVCRLAVVEKARPRFFFCDFLFFPVSPGSVLYLDVCLFLSGSLFFMLGGRFCVVKYKIDGRSLQN